MKRYVVVGVVLRRLRKKMKTMLFQTHEAQAYWINELAQTAVTGIPIRLTHEFLADQFGTRSVPVNELVRVWGHKPMKLRGLKVHIRMLPDRSAYDLWTHPEKDVICLCCLKKSRVVASAEEVNQYREVMASYAERITPWLFELLRSRPMLRMSDVDAECRRWARRAWAQKPPVISTTVESPVDLAW